jgi:hypothetical protein
MYFLEVQHRFAGRPPADCRRPKAVVGRRWIKLRQAGFTAILDRRQPVPSPPKIFGYFVAGDVLSIAFNAQAVTITAQIVAANASGRAAGGPAVVASAWPAGRRPSGGGWVAGPGRAGGVVTDRPDRAVAVGALGQAQPAGRLSLGHGESQRARQFVQRL